MPLRTHYLIPISIALIVTLVALIGSDASLWLRYDRDAILAGQLWRIVTGHLVHLGWSHLAMNLAGLGLIWVIFGSHIPWRRWLVILLVGAIGTSVFMLLFNPQLRWYVGLSGVLHTLFIAGCLADLKYRRWDSWILLVLVITKLAYEQIWGPMPGSESTAGGKVIVDAHLYGAIFGFFMMGFYMAKDRFWKAR
ncbi:MAG: rhombosortase [Gammaproteobacteria bacterium]